MTDLPEATLPENARPQPNGGWLKSGNPGHDGSNAGRPRDTVRRQAGQSAAEAAEMVRSMLAQYREGKANLTFASVLKALEILAKVAWGEKTEVVLANDEVMERVGEAIGEYFVTNGLSKEQAVELYDLVYARVSSDDA